MNYNFLNFIKSISFSNILNGTNKTLNVVKKSIPVYREIRPYMNHEKSIFNKKTTKLIEQDEIKMSKPLKDNKTTTYNDSLTFFQ